MEQTHDVVAPLLAGGGGRPDTQGVNSPRFDFSHLSPEQRLALAGDLWDSLSERELDAVAPVTPELAAELERRLAAHRADPAAAKPWDAVRQGILDGWGKRRP